MQSHASSSDGLMSVLSPTEITRAASDSAGSVLPSAAAVALLSAAEQQQQQHSKWDRLNYLRGKIEGSGAAQREKHAIIEKYAIFCTIEGVSDAVGNLLLEPSLSALISRQRKSSVGPNDKAVAASNRQSPTTLPSRRTPTGTPGSLPPNNSSNTNKNSSVAFPSAPASPTVEGTPRKPQNGSATTTPQITHDDFKYTFFLLPKSVVRKDNIPSKQMMVMPMCPIEVSATAFNTLAFCGKGQCEYGHLLSGTRNQLVNLSDKRVVQNVEGASITVRDGATVFDLATSEISEPTAGFFFACYLLNKNRLEDLRHLGAVSHDICPRYRKSQQCEFGPRCLRIHTKKRVVEKGPVDAATHLDTVLVSSTSSKSNNTGTAAASTASVGGGDAQAAPSEAELVRTFLKESGLKTVGDLCRLSEETFGMLIARYEKRSELAPILSRVGALWRLEDRQMATEKAILCFPNVTRGDAEAIPESLATVGQLIDARTKDIAAVTGLKMNVLEACLQIRTRNRRDENEPLYKQIALSDLPRNAFLVRMTEEVCKFRANAHASWRKQDATRPIVTSLITYVDPSKCKCKANNSAAPDLLSPLASGGGGSACSARSMAENCSVENYPWASHWCRCERGFERAVNYELSTPSGSRCSEQNCLGMIASKMLPTDAIREVFVHGSHHNGEDPNPLFPCGVCENMLRRVGKDIYKKTGGQLLIFMFSAVENPRKLVWMPVTEISHREGSVFKRFLEEEVRL